MEQRQLRLGDILDDYCPRERRITNHAVVAMLEDAVKQTRCTTCDAEHVYKGGKAPAKRKKKEGPETLYNQVLAGMPEAAPPVARPRPAPVERPEPPAVARSAGRLGNSDCEARSRTSRRTSAAAPDVSSRGRCSGARSASAAGRTRTGAA